MRILKIATDGNLARTIPALDRPLAPVKRIDGPRSQIVAVRRHLLRPIIKARRSAKGIVQAGIGAWPDVCQGKRRVRHGCRRGVRIAVHLLPLRRQKFGTGTGTGAVGKGALGTVGRVASGGEGHVFLLEAGGTGSRVAVSGSHRGGTRREVVLLGIGVDVRNGRDGRRGGVGGDWPRPGRETWLQGSGYAARRLRAGILWRLGSLGSLGSALMDVDVWRVRGRVLQGW